MSNAAKLKKKAVELEQKKQLDKALALYIQFLQESDGAIEDVDIPLYNRVGDLMLRTGNASDALNYYEKAVDLYADRGFLNNAIALCNKVLRQSPGRASIYYKLGKISASKGFKSDAKKNFLEYADRMQKAGQIDEAFRALKEFADLCPDQDDIRLMLAEQLTKENRQDEALEQLQKLHDKLDSEGRTVEARATVDRMKSIDPEVVPRVSGSYRAQKSQDLIFLDTSFEQNARQQQQQQKSQQKPAPASAPTPAIIPGRQVSDPDLIALTLGDTPAAPLTPVGGEAVTDTFSIDLDVPNVEPLSSPELPMLDIEDVVDLPSATEVTGELAILSDTLTPDLAILSDVAAPELAILSDVPAPEPAALGALDLEIPAVEAFSLPSDTPESTDLPAPDSIATLGIHAEHDPAPVDLLGEEPAYVSGPPLSIDYASDLAADADVTLPSDDGGLFDFRLPPRTDESEPMSSDALSTLDPDVSFPSFDLGDMSLPSADEVTSGASLAAALGDDFSLGTTSDFDLPSEPLLEPSEPEPSQLLPSASADLDDVLLESLEVPAAAAVAAVASNALDLEWPEPDTIEPPVESAAPVDIDSLELPRETPAAAVASVVESELVEATELPPASIDELAPALDAFETDEERPDDLVDAPVEIVAEAAADVSTPNELAEPDLPEPIEPELVADAAPALEVELDVVVVSATPASSPPAEAVPVVLVQEPHARAEAVTHERRPEWEIQREHAERLLELGDRAGGVQELEHVAAELERLGDLERALAIVDELIRLSPDSVRHHQKRVELAFRSNHRVKLIDAYIELGDALFRSGEERKARAVYQRVLELAPDDPRAIAAVESVASVSPAKGSGAIQAISPNAPDQRAPGASRPRDTHVSYQPGPTHAGRTPIGGVTALPPSRKPSPLDRSAATSDFVDLGEWIRSGESPKSTRMVAEEKPPTGDEQADFQEMLKRFKQGVAENVEEEDYESHYDLGVAYKEMGLLDEAVAEFQKALRGASNRTRTYEALGQCFMEKEQHHVAASVLTRAVALGEGDDHHLVGVLYLLGRATEALNKPAAALDYYQRVFAVDIEFRDVAERISAIERKAT